MIRPMILLLATFATFLPALAWAEDTKPDPWEKAIAQYEEQDRKSPPPKGAVLFVGSSSIRLWDLKKSFPEMATINRGFGGSKYEDVIRFVKRIVTPYAPRAIVMYSGDNDLAGGKSPEKVAADFASLVKAIRADLPETPLYVFGVKPSIARWKLVDKGRATNRLLEAQCQEGHKMTFLSVEKLMLGDDGMPRPELFVKDGLHLSAEGYKRWSELLLTKLHLEAR